jgi:hypothetical protein
MSTPSAGSASGETEDVPVPDRGSIQPRCLSRILNTGLDRHNLAILVGLCEAGVDPEALAAVVKE